MPGGNLDEPADESGTDSLGKPRIVQPCDGVPIMYRTTAIFFVLQAWLSAPHCRAAERWSPYCINEGEGGQVIVSIAAGKSDPEFVMFGTDVGGLYRSTNGGGHWIATGA